MRKSLIVSACISVFVASSAFAAIKTYQVTGPVVEANDTTITLMKGKEKFEIAREAATKGAGELKPGTKVTVYYHMVAEEVESKRPITAKAPKTPKSK